jgi:ribosomal protein S25
LNAESSSRSKKKKWSKGKVKEQLNNAVFFEAEGYKKMEKEIPKTKVITFVPLGSDPAPYHLRVASDVVAAACLALHPSHPAASR